MRIARSPRWWVVSGVAFIAASIAATGCTTATSPTVMFAGVWTAQLPGGQMIEFSAGQVGSHVSGTVSNFGPLTREPSPLTGTVTNAGVSLAFTFPVDSTPSHPTPSIAWSFHGNFTDLTTVSGTVTAATGGATDMTITKLAGPPPV